MRHGWQFTLGDKVTFGGRYNKASIPHGAISIEAQRVDLNSGARLNGINKQAGNFHKGSLEPRSVYVEF
jgi:hypothetical protein